MRLHLVGDEEQSVVERGEAVVSGSTGAGLAVEFGCSEEEEMEEDKSNATGVDADRLRSRFC